MDFSALEGSVGVDCIGKEMPVNIRESLLDISLSSLIVVDVTTMREDCLGR